MVDYITLKTILTLCALCNKKLFPESTEKNLIPIYTDSATLLGRHVLYRYIHFKMFIIFFCYIATIFRLQR